MNDVLFSVVLIKSVLVKFNIFVKDLNVSDISSQNTLGSLFFQPLFGFSAHVHLCL